MKEVLVRFTAPTRSVTGDLYWPSAVGSLGEDGMWDGWIEFARDGGEEIVATDRETKQPNRADLVYWAEGLSDVYLEGALARALGPERPPAVLPLPSVRSRPIRFTPRAPSDVSSVATQSRVVLDPYATYAEGEELLRKQLHALSQDHLRNIVEAFQMTDGSDPHWARRASEEELVDRIVERVRASIRPGTEREEARGEGKGNHK